MTRLLLITTACFATPALAHVGHVGAAAGHDHWVAGIAIGVAIGVSIWNIAKGRKDPEATPAEESEDDGEQEPA